MNEKISKIKIKTGDLKANLPILNPGEMAFCYENNSLYIGTPTGNVLIAKGINLNDL